MGKSYVSMEAFICPVCGSKHSFNGGILIDRHMREIVSRETVIGYSLCEEDSKLKDKGFIALIGIDPDKTSAKGNNMKLDEPYRTGEIIHIKKEIWENLFNVEIPPKGIAFVEEEMLKNLKKKYKEDTA